MKHFVFLLTFFLVSCGTIQQGTQEIGTTSVQVSESFAVATLAPVGTFEWKAAPAYTQLIILTNGVEKLLADKKISIDAAKKVHSAATAIHQQLNMAVELDAKGDHQTANTILATAGIQILALQSTLK